MPDKSEIARALAEAHRRVEPEISQIFRVVAEREDDPAEPVKLLEVTVTPQAGIVPISFGADPPDVPFPSVVIEVTEGELKNIQAGSLILPNGWRLLENPL